MILEPNVPADTTVKQNAVPLLNKPQRDLTPGGEQTPGNRLRATPVIVVENSPRLDSESGGKRGRCG